MIKLDAVRRRLLPSQAQTNFRLGVANGVLFTLGEALIDANLVLALLVRQLGGAQAAVGLLPSLKNGGWLLPQLLVAGRIQGLPRKLPLYRRTALTRMAAFALLLVVIFGAGWLGSSLALLLLCLAYTAYNLLGGSSSLAFQDLVAKVIPARRRGSFFSYRQLGGGLLAFFVAGPIVRALLAQDGPLPFPANYGLLGVVSFVFVGLGLLAFSLIDEPAGNTAATHHTLRETFAAAPRLFRTDLDFRRFIISRLWSRAGAIADPFYIIYAREVLGIAPRYVGIYLAVRVLSAALSNLYWGRLADRQGNRRLLVRTTVIAAFVPVLALLLPLALAPGSTLLPWAFSGIFLLIGLSVDGSGIAGSTYLLEIAPEAERATYCGIANTAMGAATFVPVLGGLLLAWLGNSYPPLFALGIGFSAIAWLATLRLREVREVRDELRAPRLARS